jgi:ribosomal protein S12 methylthiotransferase
VFAYSHEENTHAYKLEDDVPQEVKQSRLNEIMEIQMNISAERNETLLGARIKCIVDREDANENYICRSEHDSPDVDNEIHLKSSGVHLKQGSFVEVEIIGASEYDLDAVLV